MTNAEKIAKATVQMTEDEYFSASDDRKAVTPENMAGLLDYPALYQAMKSNRDLRPALGEGQSAGRAFNDFVSLTPEEFADRYVVSEGPTNPKTGKPYLPDSKAYMEWRSQQTKSPVTPAQFNMFGLMAKAYAGHSFVQGLGNMTCSSNVVLGANLSGVEVLFKVDKLYLNDNTVLAVDIKTTDDLCGFQGAASRLKYREQQALLSLVLDSAGIVDPQVRIAAVEKGQMPRCGIFATNEIESYGIKVSVALDGYAKSLKSGVFGTGFEAQSLI